MIRANEIKRFTGDRRIGKTFRAILTACLQFSNGANVVYIASDEQKVKRAFRTTFEVLNCLLPCGTLCAHFQNRRISSLSFPGSITFITEEILLNQEKLRGITNLALIIDDVIGV